MKNMRKIIPEPIRTKVEFSGVPESEPPVPTALVVGGEKSVRPKPEHSEVVATAKKYSPWAI